MAQEKTVRWRFTCDVYACRTEIALSKEDVYSREDAMEDAMHKGWTFKRLGKTDRHTQCRCPACTRSGSPYVKARYVQQDCLSIDSRKNAEKRKQKTED